MTSEIKRTERKKERKKNRRIKEIRVKYPHHSTTFPPEIAFVVLTIGCSHLRELPRNKPRLLVRV